MSETAYTAHGDVPYEVVQCASCGMERPKDTSKRFVIGDRTKKNSWRHSNVEMRFADGYREGWACEMCRDDTLLGFPETKVYTGVVFMLLIGFLLIGFVSGLLI